MTEEELRLRVVQLEEVETTLNTKIEEMKKDYDTLSQSKENEVKLYEQRVHDLRETNKELFLRVSQPTTPQQQEPPKPETTVIDLVNKLM